MKQACRRLKKFGLRVLQFAILGNHMHIIAEARDNQALTRGVQSLTGTFAKTCGTRFTKRYHVTPITTPRQMRNTYRYVLLNYAKHADLPNHVDPYSSGTTFGHWKKLAKVYGPNEPEAADDYGLSPPRTWLARRGWQQTG